ncbi:hypothetical protein EDD15DRAFT_2394684 [Pisolithus albus]|nr:hypothetical protein EDD15DRAFT_2394684 [Pisolithus albus]
MLCKCSLPTNMQAPLERPTGGQYDCVCNKYGFGRIHKVSHTAWLQHLANVSSEEERQRIRTARLLGEWMTSLPPLAIPSLPPTRDYSVPPSVLRNEALRGLAKRAREDRDPNEYVGRRKRARSKQPTHLNQNEDSSGLQPDVDETSGLLQPVHPDDSGMDANDIQSDRDPIDPANDNFSLPPPPSPSQSPPQDETDACSPPLPLPALHSPPRDETETCSPLPPPSRLEQAPPAMSIMYQRRVRPQINIQDLSRHVVLPKLQETMVFVSALSSATLEDAVTKLSPPALERLRNPPRQPLRIDNPGHRHSISTYLATEHSSKDAYNKVCQSTAQNFPGAPGIEDILSYHNVENLIASLTGVEKIQHDMCPNSCAAFTGPYADQEQCPLCGAL